MQSLMALLAAAATFCQLQLCSGCPGGLRPHADSTHGVSPQPTMDKRAVADSTKSTVNTSNNVSLNITIHNNRSSLLYAYVTGLDPTNGNFYVLQREGPDSYAWNTKPTGSSPIPQYYTSGISGFEIVIPAAKNVTFYLPSHADSGRIYISEEKLRFGTTQGGPDEGFVQPSVSNPSLPEFNVAFQFLEFTHLPGGFYSDVTNMDFVSIPLGLSVLSSTDGLQTVPGLVEGAKELICQDLESQTGRDGFNWAELCFRDQNSTLIRVLSPDQYLSLHPNDNLSSYFMPYVDAVWTKYQRTNLTINTQDSDPGTGQGVQVENGNTVTCGVIGSILSCFSSNTNQQYNFSKPTSAEIFGCSQGQGSPFTVQGGEDETQAEIVPRLCAAFHRSTLLLSGGVIQPPVNMTAGSYYSGIITNHYARIVHKYQKEGMGYAFAYDDANPIAPGLDNATSNAAGVIKTVDPAWVYISVGR